MELTPRRFIGIRERYLPIIGQLQDLFREMDRSYDKVAERYGFVCNGCTDNCCLTRFYHHTLLEYLFLLEGIHTLDALERQQVRQRAVDIERQTVAADRAGRSLRVMCPLNEAGRCRLYAHRPMICRLHGIPHELHPPGGRVLRNPGCDAFFDQCRTHGKNDYIAFDRTPFYRRMALLEQQLRRQVEYSCKIKQTIAQMMVTITDSEYEIDRP